MLVQVEPIGIVRGYVRAKLLEVSDNCTVEKLIEGLSLPSKFNVIAIVDGRRMSSKELLKHGAVVKVVSLALGG
ncbi:MAG: hypothetical protein ACP5VS_19690 [Desulfomonilaceae bacterium]